MARTALEDRNQSKTAFLRFFMEESRFRFYRAALLLFGRDGMNPLSRKRMGALARATIVAMPRRGKEGPSAVTPRVSKHLLFSSQMGASIHFIRRKEEAALLWGKTLSDGTGKHSCNRSELINFRQVA
jgi:hypothetical protein